MRRANPLRKPLRRLYGRLNYLNGMMNLLDHQLTFSRKAFKHVLRKNKIAPSQLLLGTSLPVSDLTHWSADGWMRFFPSGRFRARKNEYLRMMREILYRECAWAIAQGYEAFERFLKDTAAAYLHANQAEADAGAVEKFKTRTQAKHLSSADVEFWRTFVDTEYRGRRNGELFRLLRSTCPDIAEAEKTNTRALDLPMWYQAVTIVRDAVTHSGFVVSKTQDPSGLLAGSRHSYFPSSLISGVRVLRITDKNAECALKLFAEYAFMIYKCLSQKAGYDWRLRTRKKPSSPRPRKKQDSHRFLKKAGQSPVFDCRAGDDVEAVAT